MWIRQEFRVGGMIPQRPLCLGRPQRIKDAKPQLQDAGQSDCFIQGSRGGVVQIAAGPGIDRRACEIVGGGVGNFDFHIEVRVADIDEGHVFLTLVLRSEIEDKANMIESNHMTDCCSICR
jgi:hypothetical protein